jgi:hypothetical protein
MINSLKYRLLVVQAQSEFEAQLTSHQVEAAAHLEASLASEHKAAAVRAEASAAQHKSDMQLKLTAAQQSTAPMYCVTIKELYHCTFRL